MKCKNTKEPAMENGTLLAGKEQCDQIKVPSIKLAFKGTVAYQPCGYIWEGF